jgi:hypothetical protein
MLTLKNIHRVCSPLAWQNRILNGATKLYCEKLHSDMETAEEQNEAQEQQNGADVEMMKRRVDCS